MMKKVILAGGNTLLQLVKIGIFATASTYAQQEQRLNSNRLIGDFERGAKHAGHKLKLIKK